jgi:hypothetical protein
MIHHVSLPAKNPEHVAKVLAELIGGYSGPFVGPFPGSFVAYAEDQYGTGFEVYPEDIAIMAGEGPEEIGHAGKVDVPKAIAFHALVSVRCDRAKIEEVGKREGWRCFHNWRGPKGVKIFELYELWIENRVMLELATEDMLPNYVRIANGPAQQQMLGKMRL